MPKPAIGSASSHLRGTALLEDPALNKGTAFSSDERAALDLDGLLPPVIETLEQQTARCYKAFRRKTDDLERHIYLRQLQDTDETLFYRLLLDHVEEMLPMVYTPVVAQACVEFSHIYRRPRGLFIAYPLRDRIRELLANRPRTDVDVIVVTDGERILGIGDQGVGGMGIPIGKLSLYSLIGGIHPTRTLPIVLDVGTNNQTRLNDPEYLGWRHERITGDAYFEFIDRFVSAVKSEMPNTLLQWEDFAAPHARPILERYRDALLTFNDDIQGTAAVALGAISAAIKVAGTSMRDQQVVFFGAGSAAIGVADYICAAMVADGLATERARRNFWIVNRGGLLHAGRTDLTPEQRRYAQPEERITTWRTALPGNATLADVIANIDASILVGLSTMGGAFTEPMIREMARKVHRPIIFPLSNPTEKTEAVPVDLMRWTDGRALIATGSPFAPVEFGDRRVPIAQCNNVFIFPAVGLGVVASGARRVTDDMLLAAGRALGEHTPALKGKDAPLLPSVHDLRSVAIEIAVAVGAEAQRAGLAPTTTADVLRQNVVANQWQPSYDAWPNASARTTARTLDPVASHVEALLDEGLEETFPASDPLAIPDMSLPSAHALKR
jgi:malate dehydrogenase (oxaloacetate-decarboxylating)